ncbi:MAG: cation-transporting P-type ATPase [Deltaproteobacteria bacterium]|nr:cation-transporting P-type ATPase [Candidatus Zymogenaceae bacterium]
METRERPNVVKPWMRTCEEIARLLDVDIEKGLTEDEVERRLERFGHNRLTEMKKRGVLSIFFAQFKSLIVLLLLGALVLSVVLGDTIEAVAILVVILINAAIGFFTELQAVRSMEALKEMGSVSARVLRGGGIYEVPAEHLVPGDIVVMEGGDVVNADIRLTKASKLMVQEAALTGESVPVDKGVGQISDPDGGGDMPLAERSSMLFKGTSITRGSARGIVVFTGMDTELGRISSLVEEAEDEITPLEDRLDRLGHKLIWVTLGVAATVIISGIVTGKELFLMVETGIALAVAAIPEGLPIVATIALARGMFRMAKRNAIINRLSAVETLGATGVICTDKTGTLTENLMTVTHYSLPTGDITVTGGEVIQDGRFMRNGETISPSSDAVLRQALETGVLCNNASLVFDDKESDEEMTSVGDPLEAALLVAAAKGNIHREDLLKLGPEVREEAFDSDVKMMAVYHRRNGGCLVSVKGAPEPVLSVSSRIILENGIVPFGEDSRDEWEERCRKMAEDGFRVLALALKEIPDEREEPYSDLMFVGLVGLLDPPRDDVAHAISRCRDAGIKVVMVTGDQPVTARNIGLEVGLVDDDDAEVIHGGDLKHVSEMSDAERRRLLDVSIFARVTPKQKLDLIDLHQKNDRIVAMTGDGVNDAPALKEADIGIAMGQRGTQVAREAADMVLKDDAFSTIVSAVEQGRVIFNNIRKFVVYILTCNISEIMVIFFASLVKAPLPLLPLQILFINLVTDVFPALALGVGEGDPSVMKYPPRDSKEQIIAGRHWRSVFGYGFIMTISVLGAFALALTRLDMSESQAVTVSFLTLGISQLWYIFNMSSHGTIFSKNDITMNPYVWGALVLSAGLMFIAVYLPVLSLVLQTTPPGTIGWLVIIGASLIPMLVGQLIKIFSGIRK